MVLHGAGCKQLAVIFDTGSTVFGVFTWKKDLPTAIKNKLPGYYFSQNLRSDLEQVGASSRPDMFAGFGYSAYSRSIIAGLVCANLALVAGVLLVSRKLRAKGAAMREARTNYGAI
ncbi:hypothetical protein T484DRAFT_1890126 [Baffinella frigidus]|nr:hypothetical protein T484DRAFT_1890126 [Cryptophyta sp. CCMP2293]